MTQDSSSGVLGSERIGSEEASRRDTEFFRQAAREKGHAASVSEIVLHAQSLKKRNAASSITTADDRREP
jgi:hypothetical protein